MGNIVRMDTNHPKIVETCPRLLRCEGQFPVRSKSEFRKNVNFGDYRDEGEKGLFDLKPSAAFSEFREESAQIKIVFVKLVFVKAIVFYVSL